MQMLSISTMIIFCLFGASVPYQQFFQTEMKTTVKGKKAYELYFLLSPYCFKPFPKLQTDSSKLKEFADDNFEFYENG